jgi:spore coat protein U-like protein
MRLTRLFAALMALVAATALLPSAAQAQTRRCLITAQSVPALATYDPFNPGALSLNSVVITFTRQSSVNGAKAATVDFYVRSSNPGANGITLTPVSAVGAGNGVGYGQDIFYGTNETPPNITVPLGGTPIPGVFRWVFNGANDASDVFSVTFNILLPPNLNLDSSLNIAFDINYGCNGTGGGPQFSELGTAPSAFTLNIHVKSGLQASFAGPALAFGEVGDKTDAQALLLAHPTGNIRVASSGPYDISMTSASGYRMTYPGGNFATEAQNLRYQVNFLGQSRSQAMTPGTPITRTCVRAGLGSPPLAGGVLLPVSVQLLEGGDNEAPSASYSDTLDVTLTPLVALGQGVACP